MAGGHGDGSSTQRRLLSALVLQTVHSDDCLTILVLGVTANQAIETILVRAQFFLIDLFRHLDELEEELGVFADLSLAERPIVQQDAQVITRVNQAHPVLFHEL